MAVAVETRSWQFRDFGRWANVGTLAVSLALAWGCVYLAGGTRTVLPHLFYIPIMLAGIMFGIRGGVTVAAIATVLCGPLMPLDVAGGEAQALANWLARGAFFGCVGTLAGGALRSQRAGYERELARRLRRELHDATSADLDVHLDPAVRVRMKKMLRTRAFHTVFQPIFSLQDGRLVAVEALTRFDVLPQRPPDVWFDEAVSVGHGTDLEILTTQAALSGSDHLPEGIGLAVNCSPRVLCDPAFLELVERHHGRRLIVEVTEHAVVEDYTTLARAAASLRRHGVLIAVDDAGAGFSSLQHIVRLAPDIIKLDISLTQHLRDDPVRRALADCLVRFAHETGCQLIAEGIEQPSDLHTWRDLGAHAAQGYLLGRPGPLPVPTSNPAIPATPSPALTRAIRQRRLMDDTERDRTYSGLR
jgi:EAL domain-containing protein (putative c-di-GMP-specific phosphodiesterase class I)